MILQEPILLVIIPAAIAILAFLLYRDFVKTDTRYADEKQFSKKKQSRRRWMFFSRTLIITLLVIAAAGPFIQLENFIDTNPKLTILQDTSNSMSALDMQRSNELITQLSEQLPVTHITIASDNTSNLATNILAELTQASNVLLITDGQTTTDTQLSEAASYAASIDATLNALQIPTQQEDASISVHAPNQVIESTQTPIQIRIHTTHKQEVPIQVLIDNEVVLQDTRRQGTYTIEESFTQGNHQITAQITTTDAYLVNNNYTKTVYATSKPRVLYLSNKESGLEQIATELYETTVTNTLPQDISEYYAIILNDIPLSQIRSDQKRLVEYVQQGNGLFVVGGENSYDFGGYQNSVLETILPVRVGSGERSRGGANIVIAMDMSARTLGERIVDGEVVEVQQSQDIQKALAADLVAQLNPSNYVGALGFTHPLQNVNFCTGACVIQRVQQLANNKEALIDKIARVNISGGTSFMVGMQASLQLLQDRPGSKNIILFSDGVTGSQDEQQALAAARQLAAQSGTLYAVTVGTSTNGDAFMRELAAAGNGLYMRADQSNKLTALFGEPVDIDQGDAFDVTILDEYHYITQDINTQATLFGYNQVIPKTASQLLATSNGGDPILTIWNYGVGRVATLTGFNGADLGLLLQHPNSQLLSRSINWLIGSLQRKETTQIQIPDGHAGVQTRINVTAQNPPSAQNITFVRLQDNKYTAQIQPQQPGIYELFGREYAINYPKEYAQIGQSQQLQEAVALTGGRMFAPTTSAQEIITHTKELTQRKQTDQELITWPFIIAALIIYVLEVLIRRIQEIRKRQ